MDLAAALAFPGLPIHLAVKAVLTIGGWALADRRWGAKGGPKGEKAAIILGLTLGGFALGGWPLALLGVGWCGYRSLDMGGATTNWRESIERHAWFPPLVFLLAIAAGRPALQAAVPFGLYFVACVGLAWMYGREEDTERDLVLAGKPATDATKDLSRINARVELSRGATHGLAAMAAFILQLERTVH